VKDAAQLEAIAAEVRLPLILGGAGPGLSDADALAANGVRIALQGHRPIMAAVAAVYDTLAGMRSGKPAAELPKAASPQLMQQLTRDEDYGRWTKDFL
jgi:oxaloacetate decarboxylase